MCKSNWLKRFAVIAGSALLGLTLATGTNAANPETVTVNVEWAAAITISNPVNLRFGLLDSAMADTEFVIIAPDGTETDAGSNFVGGTRGAATFDTTATPSKAITILVDSVVNGTYYSLGSFICDYNGGADAPCDGAGMSETSATGSTVLRVGATLTRNAVASPTGTDNGSFDLTITYQ
jgi:hypothetical protein